MIQLPGELNYVMSVMTSFGLRRLSLYIYALGPWEGPSDNRRLWQLNEECALFVKIVSHRNLA